MDANKQKLKFTDIIQSIFPSGRSGDRIIGYQDIAEYIESDKGIFLRLIPYFLVFWTAMFVVDGLLFFIFGGRGGADCGDFTRGPTEVPTFFCGTDADPVASAVGRFLLFLVGFTAVVELLLVFFWLAGRFSKTKYNVKLPKLLDYLVWVLLFSPILVILYFILFS